jgi:uncharacterized membrane protein YdbT with pleckstrin-like domain
VEPEPGEQIFFHGHPSWRSILSFYLKGVVLAILAGAIAGVVSRVTGKSVNVAIVVLVVLVAFALMLVIGLVMRIATVYTISNQRLTIRTGILSRELHETRLERVQNVNYQQSVIERLLRVGDVTFDTAGEAGFNFAFRGVAEPSNIVRTVDRAIRDLQHRQAQPPGAPGEVGGV